ncbi:MAG: M15 family metallopeptidase [Gaiellaceae bacterium]
MPALPPFQASSSPVSAAELGASWHPGCPVGPDRLRTLHVSFVGFDGLAHRGAIVVHRDAAGTVTSVLRRLYDARFPIRRMKPVATYGGSDRRSMAADNTSGFNCRFASAPGPKRWSAHAFGTAIDVNTIENPYVQGSHVSPTAGRAYINRSRYRAGTAVAGGVLVRAFASVGWLWGGRWTSTPDYQHFSSTGG